MSDQAEVEAEVDPTKYLENLREHTKKKTLTIHVSTGTVGRIQRLYEPNDYISPVNGEPVEAFVVGLETGDAFVVDDPGTFVFLSDAETGYFLRLLPAFDSVTKSAAQYAGAVGIEPKRALFLVRMILKSLSRSLGEVPA